MTIKFAVFLFIMLNYFRINSDDTLFSISINDSAAAYPITINPLPSSPNRTYEVNQDTAAFGTSVAPAGDINGDGYDDNIVSAPYFDNGQKDEGKVYVYYGSPSGLSANADWTAESNQANALFGFCVSTAGDVNGDGYDDVIIGSPKFDNGISDEGRVYAYYGSPSGLSAYPNWIASSSQSGAQFGFAVSSIGDINNDGYSDIAVGCPYFDNGQSDEGMVFIYKGTSSGLEMSSSWSNEGNQNSGYYGYRVSGAGDVNNDGYSDLIVGAYKQDFPEMNEGRVYVYHGNGVTLSSSANWIMDGNQANAYFGFSVASAGDVNADGFCDIIVGAPQYDNGQSDEGQAYVFNGSSSGLSSSPSWTKEINQLSAIFGCSVNTAGDVNADGYSDVIVGSYLYDNGQTDEGGAFLFTGSSTGLSSVPSWIGENNQASAYFGFAVSKGGDVNLDGFSDIIVGATGFDNGQLQEGNVSAFYGLHQPLNLNLTVYTEGLYIGGVNTIIRDTIRVYLQGAASPYSALDSAKTCLTDLGYGQFTFNSANVNPAASYYLRIKHRNSLETWSDSARKFTHLLLNSDFTESSSSAFGNNLKLVDLSPDKYAIFSGDINNDGTIDATDIILTFNDILSLASGYLITDVNGDNFVDVSDLMLVNNNAVNLVNLIRP